MKLTRTPFERMLPAWLAVSVIVHAGAFAAAALLPRRALEAPRPLRWVVAGTVQPPAPPAPTTSAEPAARIEAPQVSAEAPTPRRQVIRTAHAQPRRETHREAAVVSSPTTPRAEESTQEEPAGGDRLAALPAGTSASAPEMGRPGAAFDGPLAGGGAQPLLEAADSPVSFAVAAPGPAGGSGPGLGGRGSGLGAGGSASGIGGGGTPGGEGIGSGGTGGSGDGYVSARGMAGSGPGAGGGSAPPALSAAVAPRGPAPAPTPIARPQPAPSPEPTPEPEAMPEPPTPPRATAADLSRFRSLVQSRIQSARRYPQSGREQGQEGTVRVSFSIAPTGWPGGISVAASSGIAALDREAVRAVRRAAPFRPFPRGIDSSIHVTATVTFRLN